MPGAIQWRVLALEKRADDHEVRLRETEDVVPKVTALITSVNELKDEAREANRAGWRNFWTAIIGVACVILTVIGTHYAK